MRVEEQLRFAYDAYDQQFSGVGAGVRVGPHRIMSVDVNQSVQSQMFDPLGGNGTVTRGYYAQEANGGLHRALDIGAPQGTPMYAADSGVVSYAGPGTGYGQYMDIQHFGSDLVTRYAHGSFAPGVGLGTAVTRGQLVGYVGNLGYSTGPHLHFEVMEGTGWIDPRPFLSGR